MSLGCVFGEFFEDPPSLSLAQKKKKTHLCATPPAPLPLIRPPRPLPPLLPNPPAPPAPPPRPPIALDIIAAAVKLADYMVAHSDTVKIVGTSPQASDRKTQDEVNALAVALNANAPRMHEAQRRLRIVLEGR